MQIKHVLPAQRSKLLKLSSAHMAVATGVLVAVGLITLVTGWAATMVVSREAEDSADGTYATIHDSTASGSAAILFGGSTAPGPAPAPGGKVIAVAADGSGQYATLQEGVAAAQPGDVVEIGGGTYNEQLVVNKSGSAGKPITFAARAGEKVVLDGQGGVVSGSSDGLISLSNQSYLVFDGIDVANSPSTAAWGVTVNHIVFRNCDISAIQHGGIVLIDGSDVTIDNCDVHQTNLLHGAGSSAEHEPISLSDIDGFEIKNNRVYDNKEEGIDVKYDARNGSIHHNEAYDNNGPNIYIDSAYNVKVYNNRSTTTVGDGKSGIALAIENYSQSRLCYGIDIYNNIIVGSKLAGVGFWVESTGTFHDIRVYNNTLYDNAYGLNFSTTADKFTGNNNIFRNNIVANSASGGVNFESGAVPFVMSHNLFSTGTAQTAGENQIVADPQFVNAGSDFRVQAGSAAIDTGSSDTIANEDYDGKTRPVGGAVDIGAYEQ